MRALSIHQPWAAWIAEGEKTVETRSWSTDYRGLLLICSSRSTAGLVAQDVHLRKRDPHRPNEVFSHSGKRYRLGMALAVAELYDVRRMLPEDERAAWCQWEPDRYAWCLRNIHSLIQPLPVLGQQGLWNPPIAVVKGAAVQVGPAYLSEAAVLSDSSLPKTSNGS